MHIVSVLVASNVTYVCVFSVGKEAGAYRKAMVGMRDGYLRNL
jgi:hypothetical protein